MHDVINMPDLVVRYFSSTSWLIIFIVSIIYLFFRLNTKGKWTLLITTLAFFLIINRFVIRVFTISGENSTFYRHLWAIPSIVIIGIALIDLIKILPRWSLKIIVMTTFAVLLWFVNQHEYIRCRSQSLSVEGTLVPKDIIEIGDELEKQRNETGKQTFFIVCPIGYEIAHGNMLVELNLYGGFLKISDSSILDADGHKGETELTNENPDIEYIMSMCCAKGMDYVIVSNHENTELKFQEKGYEPIKKTEAFILYMCKGYKGYRQELNKYGSLSWKTWYDEEGRPTYNSSGYCTEEYMYDTRGYCISECYYDVQGKPCIAQGKGYACLKRKYTVFGKVEEERLFDDQGNPCIRTNHGYSIIRNFYNGKFLIKQCYYNENEQLFDYDLNNPRATTLFFYDNQGNCISVQYYDKEGNRSKSNVGYDEIRKVYDNKRIIRESYYANEMLCNRTDTGYAEIVRTYDQTGQLCEEEFFDADGNAVSTEIAIQ